MKVTILFTINMKHGVVTDHAWYEYNGPVELACGASRQQKDAYDKQTSLLDTMTNQAQQIFGDSSQVFKNLVGAFTPIVAAGVNQHGFSMGEKAALESSAVTQGGIAARNAMTAVKQASAAAGGGNIALPSGATIGANAAVANAAAQNTADNINKINQADYATGRQNFFQAAEGETAAPGVFNAATSAGSAAVGAGEAAAKTAGEISQSNNSWVSAVTGALGGIAGSAIGLIPHGGTGQQHQ